MDTVVVIVVVAAVKFFDAAADVVVVVVAAAAAWHFRFSISWCLFFSQKRFKIYVFLVAPVVVYNDILFVCTLISFNLTIL